jgi:hypothetical protein
VVNTIQFGRQHRAIVLDKADYADGDMVAKSLHVVPGYGTVLMPAVNGPALVFSRDRDVKLSQIKLQDGAERGGEAPFATAPESATVSL